MPPGWNRDALRRYALSCGLLLLPAILWNVAFFDRLPPEFAMSEFWREIPRSLALAENALRSAVFLLPFLMPLELSLPCQVRALVLFVTGTLVYFASWVILMVSPGSSWSMSAMGFTAPAYTPLLWLLGISLLGRRLFWGTFYRWWMYLVVVLAFLVTHISHTALVYSRSH